jgi:hypothetical protein
LFSIWSRNERLLHVRTAINEPVRLLVDTIVPVERECMTRQFLKGQAAEWLLRIPNVQNTCARNGSFFM